MFKTITISHKIAATLTAAIFLFTTIGTDLAWAIKAEPGFGGASVKVVRKDLIIDDFQIPASLGTIEDKHKGQAGTIIYIQDAHCNYPAQKSISNIISHLNDSYGVDLINLEGGEGDYDLSLFTDINDKNVREKVSDYFVKEGRVSGPEFFAINNTEKVTLFGLEDADLYIKNLDVYRDSLEYVTGVNSTLNYIIRRIEELKESVYTKNLKELDRGYDNFLKKETELKDFLEYLFELSLKKRINLKSFPNIRSLYEAISKEKDIDFKKANSERDRLIEDLKEKLSDNAMDELALRGFLFKTGDLSQGAYYTYLKRLAEKYRVSLKKRKNLREYITYINHFEASDKIEVFNEIEKLYELIAKKEFKSKSQEKLFNVSKNVKILKNIFNIKATKREINYFNEHKSDFDISTILEFLQREFQKLGESPHFDNSARLIDIHRDEITKF